MIESSFEFTVSSKNKPILIASGHEFYFKRKNKFTENWICSKYQTHKCRATAITENNELIETRGEHNHDISAGKSEARNVIKHIKDLSERFTPTVAVASAVLPITNDLATQFALPSKDKLIRTLPSKDKHFCLFFRIIEIQILILLKFMSAFFEKTFPCRLPET